MSSGLFDYARLISPHARHREYETDRLSRWLGSLEPAHRLA
jgi:hypothetical protein